MQFTWNLFIFSADGPLVMRVHAFLERFGYINFGIYKRVENLPGKRLTVFFLPHLLPVHVLVLFEINF